MLYSSWQAKKICVTQENFYLQGILNDINVHYTSCVICKRKVMMKSRAPPDKIGVLHCLLPIEFHGFTSRIDFTGLSLFVSWYYLNFLEGVWVSTETAVKRNEMIRRNE